MLELVFQVQPIGPNLWYTFVGGGTARSRRLEVRKKAQQHFYEVLLLGGLKARQQIISLPSTLNSLTEPLDRKCRLRLSTGAVKDLDVSHCSAQEHTAELANDARRDTQSVRTTGSLRD